MVNIVLFHYCTLSFFMPEPTRGCCALFHIQYSSKCISASTYKHYLLLLKSTELTAFGHVLANSTNFMPVKFKIAKWLLLCQN